jgi:DNA (cytosine-5)-methyltransferase 1
MNELHLFAGAGGGILGGILCGHTTVCAVEIEPYPRKVLLQRQRDGILPRFPIWDDVTTFDGKPWRGHVDIVCGGFPCQDISSAGNGQGITGERSGLWSEMARIIHEVGPKYVIVENSPMLTVRGLGVVLGDLAEMGYHARWGVLGSCDAGLPTKRDRLWIVASTGLLDPNPRKNEGRNREEILLRKWASGSCQRVVDFGGVAAIEVPERASVDYGMADWMDELKAIGNGQSPALVELAWNILKP